MYKSIRTKKRRKSEPANFQVSQTTQRTNEKFIDENYFKAPKKTTPLTKTDVFHINDTRTLDILDLKDYGLESNRGYRYVLVVIDKISKYGSTVPLKNKKAQTIEVF